MPKKKKKGNKKLLILILLAVILAGLLFWGIPYFNKSRERDLASANNQTMISQKPENDKQKPIVKTDKTVTGGKTVKADEIVISDKTVRTDEIIISDKTVRADGIVSSDKTVRADEIVISDKTVRADEIVISDKTVRADGIVSSDKTVKANEIVRGKIVVLPDIDYKNLEKDEKLKQLMVSRKKELGFDKSLDMIVNSNETFKVGDVQIPLRDILEKVSLKEGKVFEEKIEDSGVVQPEIIKKFGIYVVQPGDNIWNIHFNILKEYYEHQGIKISPVADEPISKGMSSGIGKILKFSETMVIIYNFVEQKIDSNIDLLEPLSKIVIYNMDEIFSLLQEINYESINRIQFDGKTIWVPTKKI